MSEDVTQGYVVPEPTTKDVDQLYVRFRDGHTETFRPDYFVIDLDTRELLVVNAKSRTTIQLHNVLFHEVCRITVPIKKEKEKASGPAAG